MSSLLGLRDEAVALDVDACMTWVLRFVAKRDEEKRRMKSTRDSYRSMRQANRELALWMGYVWSGQHLPPMNED